MMLLDSMIPSLLSPDEAQGGAERLAKPPPRVHMPEMLTVKELAKECKAYGISEYHVRLAIKQGKFPTVTTGRKVLINRDVFIRYLGGERFD